MSTRVLFILTATAGLLASPLASAASDGWRASNNEAGFEFSGITGGFTREQVKQDLELARRDGSLRLTERNHDYSRTETAERSGFISSAEQRSQALRAGEVTPRTGWQNIGGEAGWTYEGR